MCMVDSADGGNEFSSEYRTKSGRKEYQCYECGRKIKVGEPFVNHVWKFDGDFSHVRTCIHCEVACKWLFENCAGYLVGCVLEDIMEHVSEYKRVNPPLPCMPDLIQLEFGMRNKWILQDASVNGQLSPLPKLPARIESEQVAA